ncbi:pyrroline-5-carboxylate reductase [Pseudomonas syringae]|uniref:pyrroline-5-carboxylate reductase n=1 Tax=Pseudomonas syringae TaxID=317 RepID=UPI00227711BE|nr:pyrroline-5-carboxylate reductase [Pseudomonas syringae]
MRVLIVGYGRMGSALGEAWIAKGLVSKLIAVDPSANSSTVECYSDMEKMPKIIFDVVVVAVKPQYVSAALPSIAAYHLGHSTVVISVAAGIPILTLLAHLPQGTAVVRAMPNTPVLLGAGCTGMFSSVGSLSLSARERVTNLFSAVGTCYWVEEERHLDIVTAISGSGPAYFHLFCESLFDAGVRMGLSRQLARNLVVDTAWGAAVLQRHPQADFAALRQNVTSPNGTTAAAIGIFEENGGLRKLVASATDAARLRSEEMSRA